MNFSTREVLVDGQQVVLRFRTAVGLTLVVSAVAGLVAARFVMGMVPPAAAQTMWPILVGAWTVGTLFNLGWLFWWMTVVFDRGEDRVRRGRRTVGRVSAITGVERGDDPRTPLLLVLRESNAEERRWPIPGITPAEADVTGTQLAAALNVPFR
jgi:hypothetical protein